MAWITISATVLFGALLFYCLFHQNPKRKFCSNGFSSEFVKKILEKSIAVMVLEKSNSLIRQQIAEDIDKYIVKNFVDAIKEIVTQKIGRLSSSEINIAHISINNKGNTRLQLSVDVVVVINVETNKKNEIMLVFKYFKRSAGTLQEIIIAEPTKIPLSGTTKSDLDKINFYEKLIEGFAGLKDAVKGKRIIPNYRRKTHKA